MTLLNEIIDALPENPKDRKLSIAKSLRRVHKVPASFAYTGGGFYVVSVTLGDLVWEFGDHGGWAWSKSRLVPDPQGNRFPEFMEGGTLFPADSPYQNARRTIFDIVGAILSLIRTDSSTDILLATGPRSRVARAQRTFCRSDACNRIIEKNEPHIISDGYGLICETCALAKSQARRVPYVGVNPDPAARVTVGNMTFTTRIDAEDGHERCCILLGEQHPDRGNSIDVLTRKGDRVQVNLFDHTQYEGDAKDGQVMTVDTIPQDDGLHGTVILFGNPNIPTGLGTPKVETASTRIYAEFEGTSGPAVIAAVIRRAP